MEDDPDWLNKLYWKAEYLESWLEKFKSAEDVAPEVQKNLEFTRWQIEAVEACPDESSEVPFPNLTITLDSDIKHLETALPLIPTYDKEQILGSTSFTASGTASIFDFTVRVGDLGTEDAEEYSGKFTIAFQELQKKYDRPNEVRELIERTKNPNTLERFDAARECYESYQIDNSQRTAVAVNMRNLIDGVKGDLFKAAQQQPKENMTWSSMANRIARGGPDGPQAAELLGQEEKHSALVTRLSDVLKDREAGSFTNIDYLWSDVLDYLVAVLGLVDVKSFQ
jgi:hypothetical protein